jgi:hypothetical protein
MSIKLVATAQNVTCMETLSKKFIFVGSRLSNSHLFEISELIEQSEEVEADVPLSKHVKASIAEDIEVDLFGQKLDDENAVIIKPKQVSSVVSISLKEVDVFPNIAPQPGFVFANNFVDDVSL